jgi:hypothetical protein
LDLFFIDEMNIILAQFLDQYRKGFFKLHLLLKYDFTNGLVKVFGCSIESWDSLFFYSSMLLE